MNTIFNFKENEFIDTCNHHPKYKALALLIEQAINNGQIANHQKLPAQRFLADQLNITHGTVTRAYALLEKRGLVKVKLGSGTYANSANANAILLSEHDQIGGIEVADFASSMQPMFGQQELIKSALINLSQDIDAVIQVMNYSPKV